MTPTEDTSPTISKAPVDDFELPLRSIRQPAGVNLFKQLTLGGEHNPGVHQSKQVQQVFADVGLGGTLDPRTWQGWFGPRARRARSDGVSALDRYMDVLRDPGRAEFPDVAPTGTFFRELMLGGLPSTLAAPTEAKQPVVTMLERSVGYTPQSAVHLHLDAIEAAAMSEGAGSISWEQLKGLTGQAVLCALNARWAPRGGTIYGELSSPLDQKLRTASAEERMRIRAAYAQYKPDRFEVYRRAAPQPQWAELGVTEDFCTDHIYKALFLLSLDQEFLVDDRFEAWALDMASAAFGMHAVAYADRYVTHGVRTTPESIYWRAFNEIFFPVEDDTYFVRVCVAAFEMEKASWDERALTLLRDAGDWYHGFLRQLGLDPSQISRVVRRCWSQKRFEFGRNT